MILTLFETILLNIIFTNLSILAIQQTHQLGYMIKNCNVKFLNTTTQHISCFKVSLKWSNNKRTINTVLKIAAISFPPHSVIKRGNKSDTISGNCAEILSYLSTVLNFSQHIVEPPDRAFGNFINNTWTGMMHLLVTNKADIAFMLTPTKDRLLYVNFSPYMTSYPISLIFRKLNRQTWNIYFLFQTFDIDTWLCILLLTFLTCLLLFLSKFMSILNLLLLRKHQFSNRRSKLHFLWHNLFQKRDKTPASSQIALQCFYISSLIVYTGYTGRLTSQFAVIKTQMPFNSLEEMIMKTDYFPVVIKDTSVIEYFEHGKSEPWITGWKRMIENKPHSSTTKIKESLDIVYSMNAAFLLPKPLAVIIIASNCSFDLAPKPIGIETESIVYSNQFPYKDLFNEKSLWLREIGNLSIVEKKFYSTDYISNCDNTFRTVSLHVVFGQIVVIVIGFGLAVIMLLIEIVAFKFNRTV